MSNYIFLPKLCISDYGESKCAFEMHRNNSEIYKYGWGMPPVRFCVNHPYVLTTRLVFPIFLARPSPILCRDKTANMRLEKISEGFKTVADRAKYADKTRRPNKWDTVKGKSRNYSTQTHTVHIQVLLFVLRVVFWARCTSHKPHQVTISRTEHWTWTAFHIC